MSCNIDTNIIKNKIKHRTEANYDRILMLINMMLPVPLQETV